jgi:mannosyl-oligosaccharide alpha-1,2-mannosidase
LSAYDLINSNLVPRGTYKSKHVKALLSQAKILGDRLKPQFNTPSGLPAFFLNWTTGEIQNTEYSVHNKTYNATNTAIAGTIILEFYRLSDLTGDQSYRKLVRIFTRARASHADDGDQADKAESYIVNPSPSCKYPGLVGSQLDVNTGKFLNQEFGWQSGIDSFYEASHSRKRTLSWLE